MSNITVAFWGCLIIANVWMASGGTGIHEIFWLAMAMIALTADLFLKFRK